MIDAGEYRTAYLIARDAALPARDIYKTEQEFTAGWIALRFLNDPGAAAQHFARIGVGSVNPTALARAGYWQGRAAEAAGRAQEARAAYARAAEQSTSYYGQLARAKLGLPQIELNGVRRAAAAPNGSRSCARCSCSTSSTSARSRSRSSPTWARTAIPMRSPASANSTARYGDARGMLLIGKAALNRGLPFDFYAYPVNGIPPFKPIGPEVEREHRLRDRAAGKRLQSVGGLAGPGLRADAGDAGRRPLCLQAVTASTFDLGRMKTDPVYNAALGAAELGGLIEDYRGSYIMTFAAYNAGRGSVKKWIERYGDPRDPKVDAVDWVELIPFSETRNYVQRIMENLQVYRARFGGGTQLQIEADLHRGASVE